MARDVAQMAGLATDLPPDQMGSQAFRELNMVPGSAISMRPRCGTQEIAQYEPLVAGRVIIVDALPADPTNGLLINCQNNRLIGGVMSHYTEFLAAWRPSGQSSDFSATVGTALGPKIYGEFSTLYQILDFLFGTYTPFDPDTQSGFTSYFPCFLRPATYDERGYPSGITYSFPSGVFLMAGKRTSPVPRVMVHVYDAATGDESEDTALQEGVTGATTAFNIGACPLNYPYNGFVFWWNDSSDNTPRVRVVINANLDISGADLSGMGTYGFTLTNTDVLTGSQIADITPAARSRQSGLLVGKRSATAGNYQLVYIAQPINLPLAGATTIAYTTNAHKEFLVTDWTGWSNRPDTCLDVQQIVLNSQVNAGRIAVLLGNWVSPTLHKAVTTPRLALLSGTNQSGQVPTFGDDENDVSALGVLNSHATGTLSDSKTQGTIASATAGTPSGSTITWIVSGTRAITGSIAAGEKSTYVKATNYGFALPAGAVIDYIQVTVTRKAGANTSATSLKDNSAKLLIAGTPTGTDMAYTGAFWGDTGYEQIIYGGSVVSAWGIGGGLTGADINASTFGFALSAVNSGTDPATAGVLTVEINVVYDANSFHGHGMVADQHGYVYATGTGDFVANEATYLIMKYDPRDLTNPVARVAHESNGLGDYYADPLDTHICNPMIDGAYLIVEDIDPDKSRLFIYDLSLTYLGVITIGQPPTGATTGATAANVDNGGGTAWTVSQSPGRGVCSAALDFDAQTDFLEITNFGFALPTGAIITGVVATITRDADVASAAFDQNVKLIVSGSIAGTNQADFLTPWPTASTAATYGAFNSVWGATLTRAIVNASNFGVAISAVCDGADVIPSVQSVALTIYYATGETCLVNKFATKFFAQNY